jgi:hypothetical protein
VIQIEAIRIREFRGIRDLSLTFNRDSFVVWGPNGSGKSGVVDAIDFAITGNIARLAGKGSGGVTVLRHGPHVHRRDDPALAVIDLTVYDTSSGKSAVLTRNVKSAKTFTLAPDDVDVRRAIESAHDHPELTLSRREVIKYILVEPGSRAQEVQAVLKLDRLERVRGLLRTAKTKTASKETAAQATVTGAQDAMQRHLDLPALHLAEVSKAINGLRAILNLSEFETITLRTDIASGVENAQSESVFDNASTLRDVDALSDWLNDHPDFTSAIDAVRETVSALEAEPHLAPDLKTRALVDAGIELVVAAACPLCDTSWPDAESLRRHLTDKAAKFESATKLAAATTRAGQTLASEFSKIQSLVSALVPHAARYSQEFSKQLAAWAEDLSALAGGLRDVPQIIAAQHRLINNPVQQPPGLAGELASLRKKLDGIPDQSATAAARASLTVAGERWTRLRLTRIEHAQARAANKAAAAAYEIYCATSDNALSNLYKQVESQFSKFYREINGGDESAFRAVLDPSAGKLDLTVDFYGLGLFPPSAYHSEGHQDGMGICLYLALILQLLGADFRFAVLDDVVMSVDTSHRRKFCELLRHTFPNVQFIITTHDEVWARQMRTSGLVKSKAQAHFSGWSVDEGLTVEVGELAWDRIQADLAKGDVPAAAARLRRSLESVMGDLVTKLQGTVRYNPHGVYDLGDLMSSVKGAHGRLLKQAADAANSWNNEPDRERIKLLKEARSAAVFAQEGEQWAVNSSVHYNDWASLSPADFQPVIEAWKEFFALFTCDNPDCDAWVYVTEAAGEPETLRCTCGRYSLNLRKKTEGKK